MICICTLWKGVLQYWLLIRRTGGFSTQRASIAETFSLSQCHHVGAFRMNRLWKASTLNIPCQFGGIHLHASCLLHFVHWANAGDLVLFLMATRILLASMIHFTKLATNTQPECYHISFANLLALTIILVFVKNRHQLIIVWHLFWVNR